MKKKCVRQHFKISGPIRLVEGPKVLRSYRLMSTRMRNRLDANVQISLYPYAVLQPLMVMALLDHLVDRSTPTYCHNRPSINNTLMAKTVSIYKKIVSNKNNYFSFPLNLKNENYWNKQNNELKTIPNVGWMWFKALDWAITTNIIQDAWAVFMTRYQQTSRWINTNTCHRWTLTWTRHSCWCYCIHTSASPQIPETNSFILQMHKNPLVFYSKSTISSFLIWNKKKNEK